MSRGAGVDGTLSAALATLTSLMNLMNLIVLKILKILGILIELTLIIANDIVVSFCAL